MTAVLAAHWATGQSALEDANLAALMGWIAPSDGLTGPEAAAAGGGPAAVAAGRAGDRPELRQRGAGSAGPGV